MAKVKYTKLLQSWIISITLATATWGGAVIEDDLLDTGNRICFVTKMESIYVENTAYCRLC